jgi:hypothetical protein
MTHISETTLKTNDETNTFLVCFFVLSHSKLSRWVSILVSGPISFKNSLKVAIQLNEFHISLITYLKIL